MFNPKDRLLDDKRFEIIEQLGRGGMSLVYKAYDTKLGRLVAIKVLLPNIAGDRRFIRDLRQEAKTTAGLQHQNIVAIYDLYEWDGRHFIVMEFVDGKTLEDLILDEKDNFQPLPTARILNYAIQICAGLQFVHDRRIYHRDIKPKNIMVTADEVVKITDFGISHIVKQTMTRLTGQTTGTLPYMAPEQFAAEPADARSDIYALGISLYEILTNDLPFPGPDFAYQHRSIEIKSPTERVPSLNIPAGLSAIVMKCLAKDPNQRFASVSELHAAFAALREQLRDFQRLPELIEQARLEEKRGNYAKAIQIWQKILNTDPANQAALAEIALVQKLLDQQQDQAQRQTQIDALVKQAQAASQVGNDEQVIELCRQILALDPENGAARSGLDMASKSVAKKRQQEERQQKEHERQAQIQMLFQEAHAEAAVDNYQKVIILSQRVLDLDPDNLAAKTGIDSARKALENQKRELERLMQRAQEEHKARNYNDAIQTWKQILHVDPYHQAAKAGLQSTEQALAEQQRRERDQLIQQAQEQQRAGAFPQALQIWKRVLQLEPENSVAKAGLEAAERATVEHNRELGNLIDQAQDEENKGELEQAIKLWEKVLQMEANHTLAQSRLQLDRKILAEEKARDERLLTEQRQREQEERKRQTQQAEQRRTQVDALITKAQNEEHSGQTQTALQTWQSALQLAPENRIVQAGVTRTQAVIKQQKPSLRKIDYAVAAASVFIQHLHRENFDHGLIATFGDTLRIEQDFTASAAHLQAALARVQQSVGGQTRLYDSIEDIIGAFWRVGLRDRPWLLTIITDGIDGASQRYRNNPAGLGRLIAQSFMHEPDNFIFLIGVGTGKEIDANALSILGQVGGFPAMTIQAFPLLEQLFVEIALQVSEQLVGRRVNYGNVTWEEVASSYQLSPVALDYAFLIDRSGSMNNAG